MSDSESWFLYTAEGQSGPYTTAQLKEWLAAGSITADWSVWRDGFAEWKRIGDLPELTGGAPPLPPIQVQPAPTKPPEPTPEALRAATLVAADPRPGPGSATRSLMPQAKEDSGKSGRRGPSPAFIVIVIVLLLGGGYLAYLKSSDEPAFIALLNSCGLDEATLASWGMVTIEQPKPAVKPAPKPPAKPK